MMLGVVRTPQAIPLSESFTNHGWPRNGCRIGSAPVLQMICILKARGKMGSANLSKALGSAVRQGLTE